MSASTVELVRSVAAHGLAGSAAVWPDRPLEAAQWSELILMVERDRLGGLLLQAVTDGVLLVTDEQLDRASALHVKACCHVLRLESEAVAVLGLLTSAGIESKVLKGSAVAHLDYPDPSLRVFADVDLLVRSEDVDGAIRVLTASGCARHGVEPRRGFDRQFGKGATFTSSSGYEIDLHRTFVMGPYGLRIDLADLWAQPTYFDLGGLQAGALDPECRFLHACFHTALGDRPPRLVAQRDLAQMLLHGNLDLERVGALMHTWKAEPVVARAVRVTWDNLRIGHVTALSAWASEYVPRARDTRELAAYGDEAGSSYTALSIAALAALPSLRAKAVFALSLAAPRRGFVPEQGTGTGRHRWRRAARALLRQGATS